jgi:hypothetical protein
MHFTGLTQRFYMCISYLVPFRIHKLVPRTSIDCVVSAAHGTRISRLCAVNRSTRGYSSALNTTPLNDSPDPSSSDDEMYELRCERRKARRMVSIPHAYSPSLCGFATRVVTANQHKNRLHMYFGRDRSLSRTSYTGLDSNLHVCRGPRLKIVKP